MSPFFERLRAALAPDYELLRELASGGMGTVYLAREIALDCLVAVKVLRPELVTADSVTRFVREAQTLRKVRHPTIVVVHTVEERHGLHLYVMDFLEGETLQHRLATRGRLTHHEALKLGRDLLEALEVVHSRGVIHRDIKPSNLFWLGRRAVLTDFGIAKVATTDPTTDPHFMLGTAPYMAPELFGGVEANERTDLYSAGMVIYEAFTGRRWGKCPPRDGDWSGVPRGVARVLGRALEHRPPDRWPDAATFRHELWRTRVWPFRRNVIGVALACTLLGIRLGLPGRSTTFHLSLQSAGTPPGLPAWLGDSVACGLAQRLNAYPGLAARCTSGLERLWARWSRGLRIRPELESDAGGAWVRLTGSVEGIDGIAVRGAPDQWPVLVDSLADRVSEVLYGSERLLDPSLSRLVLPKALAGRQALLRAERAFARGHWRDARAAYAAAAAIDPTCWICYWRHAEVGRWFNLEDDAADAARYRAHTPEFPEYYQTLIRAERLPTGARLDSLEVLTHRWKDFLFGQFRRGDEVLHRGPLVGRSRREAAAPLEAVLKLEPEFAPGLQHLAWVHIAEGDSAEAGVALARAERLADPGDPSFATLAMLELAYAWRFLPRDQALARTDELVARARAAGIADLDAGARYLAGLGSPEGELAFAERLAREPRFARSAGIARVLALVGLGRPDTALALARGVGLRPFAAQLAAATLLVDGDSARFVNEWPPVRAELARDTADRRAGWMLRLVEAAGAGDTDPLPPSVSPIFDPNATPPVVLLDAVSLARRGARARALEVTEALTDLPVRDIDDPFFRAVLHALRAQWYERAGQAARASRELLWAENTDVMGYPTGSPQAAEVDWAFAPLAQWRLARLLARRGSRADVCRAYRGVARLWAAGEPRYRARADSAARRLRALECRGSA